VPGVPPARLLFVLLGAGSHLFEATALARESVGIDPSGPPTREDLVVLLRKLFESGVFPEDGETSWKRPERMSAVTNLEVCRTENGSETRFLPSGIRLGFG
jgi:hypothetical protein